MALAGVGQKLHPGPPSPETGRPAVTLESLSAHSRQVSALDGDF
jgi:hypothetical protein